MLNIRISQLVLPCLLAFKAAILNCFCLAKSITTCFSALEVGVCPPDKEK